MESRNIVVTAALEKIADFRERKYASIKQSFEEAMKKRAAVEAAVMYHLANKSEETIENTGETMRQGYLEPLIYDLRPSYPVDAKSLDDAIDRFMNAIVKTFKEELR